jgi:hypothetical protein
VTNNQSEQARLGKGSAAMCDIIDDKKQPTGEQIEVTIMDVRHNGETPQSYRVYCKTERGTDKYIWVKAEYIHEKLMAPIGEEGDTELSGAYKLDEDPSESADPQP